MPLAHRALCEFLEMKEVSAVMQLERSRPRINCHCERTCTSNEAQLAPQCVSHNGIWAIIYLLQGPSGSLP